MRTRRGVIITTAALVLVIGATAVYGVWRVLGRAPAEVSLEAAVASVEQKETSESVESAAPSQTTQKKLPTEEPAAKSQDGVWHVDSTSGSFTFEESSGSFVGFRVEEELARVGSVTAVGRTGEVQGELLIDNGQLVKVSISADLSTVVTNDSRRDRAARHALNVRENPVATFLLDAPVVLPDADDSPVSIEVLGRLTVNGIGQMVPVFLEAQLVENTIVVVGSIEVTFADYDVAVPSAVIVVSAKDHGVVEFQLLFVRG